MKRPVWYGFVAASFLAYGASSLLAHPGHTDEEGHDEPAPDFSFDPADVRVPATMLGEPLWYDADVLAGGDSLGFAWLEFTRGKGDRVWTGAKDGDVWRDKRAVTESHGQYAHPTLTRNGQGEVWLSYEALVDGQWDLFALLLDDEGPQGRPLRVSAGAGSDVNHRAAADPEGGIWFAWQTDHGGQFDVVARRLTDDDQLDRIQEVGAHPGGDWRPALAIASDGAVHVAWDAYDSEAYNVHLRTLRDGRWGETTDIARSAAFEGRADLVVDAQGNVCVAWEEGGPNWGKPFRGINTELVTDQNGPLHRYRLLRLAIVRHDGSVGLVKDALPLPSVEEAKRRPDAKPGAERLGAFYERAGLCLDHAGRLWVVYRHYYTPWLGVRHRSHVEEGWGVYARWLGPDGWSKLYRFDIGQGDGMQRLEVAPQAGGLAAVWTTGRTHRDRNRRPRGVAFATLGSPSEGEGFGKAGLGAVGAVPMTETGARDAPRGQPPRPEAVAVGGKRYQLFFGDLHRHTDLSLCRVPLDGSLEDAYRYAIDAAGLDFLGVTDHSRDIARGDALSQLWHRGKKEVTRMQLAETFVPFFAYERSHGNTADHNVISLRDDMLRPHTYPVPEFWKELDRDTLTIPHQPIRRDTWKYQDDRLRPLVEIFQGCRDNSIEEDVHRGLAKGYHLGFIASSDHMATSSSYACVWAEEPTRESIFRAMQARRTYGATANIRLLVRAGDHWMGERVAPQDVQELTLEAEGTAPIRSVRTIADGELLEELSPNRRQLRLTLRPNLAGRRWVYFHLTQADGNEAWSSPLWLDAEE